MKIFIFCLYLLYFHRFDFHSLTTHKIITSVRFFSLFCFSMPSIWFQSFIFDYESSNPIERSFYFSWFSFDISISSSCSPMHKCVKKNENKTTIKNKNTVLSAMNKRIRSDNRMLKRMKKKYPSTDIISITVAIRKREQKIFIFFV